MEKEFLNRKILMIDDEPELLEVMKDLLEEENYQVFCASNGAEGIQINEQKNPDLIILDLRMPEMDGIETLRNIRKSDNNVRVVVLTGYGCPDTIRDAADLNVSEYLSKPFENEELVSIISKALEL
ncbi:MAG: response regulator [Bacteroidetes bacterium]|nr:response regulator [Bacteroidota bacterium]